MNWSSAIFFYLAVAFAIYIFAIGDNAKWKQILTTKNYGANGSGGSSASALAGEILGNNSGIGSQSSSSLMSGMSEIDSLGSGLEDFF